MEPQADAVPLIIFTLIIYTLLIELLFCLHRTLFEVVLFEECSNQWSLSRPMLSLILINEQIYNDLKVSAAKEKEQILHRLMAARFESESGLHAGILPQLSVLHFC